MYERNSITTTTHTIGTNLIGFGVIHVLELRPPGITSEFFLEPNKGQDASVVAMVSCVFAREFIHHNITCNQ